jgi:hypothetical protein
MAAHMHFGADTRGHAVEGGGRRIAATDDCAQDQRLRLRDSADARPSFLFNDPVNVTEQGALCR